MKFLQILVEKSSPIQCPALGKGRQLSCYSTQLFGSSALAKSGCHTRRPYQHTGDKEHNL